MRTIKNFFHDINDILLAIIIVALATGIIYWRMGIILDYPKQLAAQQASYQQEEETAEIDDAEDAEDAEEADNEAEPSEQPAEEQSGDGAEENVEPQG